jgi:hypothetical protein
LRWEDLNLLEGTLTIREVVAKNHREATVPLNHWLIQQLAARQARFGRNVFEAPTQTGYINNLNRPLADGTTPRWPPNYRS